MLGVWLLISILRSFFFPSTGYLETSSYGRRLQIFVFSCFLSGLCVLPHLPSFTKLLLTYKHRSPRREEILCEDCTKLNSDSSALQDLDTLGALALWAGVAGIITNLLSLSKWLNNPLLPLRCGWVRKKKV